MKHFLKKTYENNRNLILPLIGIAPFYLIFGCPIRFIAGLCCPGCGMSRALWYLLCLDFEAAYHMHPLVFLLPVAAVVILFRHKIPKKLLIFLGLTALALLAVVFIIRLTSGSEIVYWDFEKGAIYKLFHRITN